MKILLLAISALCLFSTVTSFPSIGVMTYGNRAQGQSGSNMEDFSTLETYQYLAITPQTPHDAFYNDTDIQAIATGNRFTVAVTTRGRVISFGRNEFGQLGDGTQILRPAPVYALISKNVTMVAAGGDHTGQLGAGMGMNFSSVPVPVDMSLVGNAGRVIQLAAGDHFSIALRDDGEVFTWGRNNAGQLGIGLALNFSDTPVQFSQSSFLYSPITFVAAGAEHAIALVNTLPGTAAVAWGSNEYYQLGASSVSVPEFPEVPHSGSPGKDIVQVSAGRYHSMILYSDNSVSVCGSGEFLHLGTGSNVTLDTPTQVFQAPSSVKQILAKNMGSMVLLDDGNLYFWGENSHGHLNPLAPFSLSPVNTPTQVDLSLLGGRKIVSIDAYTQTAAKLNDGSFYLWGSGSYGQLGTGILSSGYPSYPSPPLFSSLHGKKINKVAAARRVLAMTTQGELYAWGPVRGPIGTGTQNPLFDYKQMTPVAINMTNLQGKSIRELYSSRSASYVLTTEGEVYAWGDNRYKQSSTAVGVSSVMIPTKMEGLPAIKSMSTFGDFVIAITANNTLMSWGRNFCGQLGIGTTTTSTPQYVNMSAMAGETITKVSASMTYSMALSASGKVYNWGCGHHYQLGDGTFDSSRSVPQLLSIDTQGDLITDIAAGEQHAVVMTANSAIYHWGFYYSIDNETSYQFSTPTLLNTTALGGKKIIQLRAGNRFSAVLTEDNEVYSWGLNSEAQLGDGTLTSSPTPVRSSVIGSIPTGKEANLAVGASFVSVYVTEPCYGIRPESELVCNYRNGTCVALDTCVCNPGYIGDRCQVPVCYGIPANDSSVCSGNGTCILPDTCTCIDNSIHKPYGRYFNASIGVSCEGAAAYFEISSNILSGEIALNDSTTGEYVLGRSVSIGSNAKVIIPEGITIIMKPNTQITVHGTLDLQGTTDNPVIIQSEDNNWSSIQYASGAKANIGNVRIIGGGGGDARGSLEIRSSDVVINNVEFVGAAKAGVYVVNALPDVGDLSGTAEHALLIQKVMP